VVFFVHTHAITSAVRPIGAWEQAAELERSLEVDLEKESRRSAQSAGFSKVKILAGMQLPSWHTITETAVGGGWFFQKL
jgi:hypothetical protein